MNIHGHILIVDDEKINRDLLSDLLKPDYKIMVAKDGFQALKAAKRAENQPDLILLDVMMPEMDGYDVCRQLKLEDNTKNIPVIFITAKAEESDEEKGFELGAVDYITKPISPPLLKARVKTHLSLKSLRDNLEEQVDLRTEALKAALLESKAAALAKSEFLSRVSHELRTPLNAIIAPAAQMANESSDAAVKEKMLTMQSSAEGLLNIINKMMELNKLDSQSASVDLPFDLQEQLNNIDEQWSSLANDKNLTWTVELTGDNPVTSCIGDARYLRQALDHLIENAFKFTEKGVIKLSVSYLGIYGEKPSFKFELSDTGVGIDADKIKEVFEPFSQSESTGTRKYGGIGIGLSLAKRFIEQLGGEIEVSSDPGQGSVFTFEVQFELDESEINQSEPQISPAEVSEQLDKLKEIVDEGYIAKDFLCDKIQPWMTTPWRDELMTVVDMLNQYDDDGALELIDQLKEKIR